MFHRIGIRIEDKNEWERRVPLVPTDVGSLIKEHGIGISIQPMANRAFSDAEYRSVGATVDPELKGCEIMFGIKEMPIGFFLKGRTYIFFAHVIKGQKHNMPMLRRLMELGCNLLDYEKIVDDNNRRLVFFGNEAGQAGMIDTLWALGKRIQEEGIDNPFTGIRRAVEYRNLSMVENALEELGKTIQRDGVPKELHPIVIGFAGYGNVSKGAQRILDFLPVIEVTPEELLRGGNDVFSSDKNVYKVVFKENHTVELIDKSEQDHPFRLQDYFEHPEKYTGVFAKYVPHLTVLMNCIYWSEKYPRLVTKDLIHSMYSGKKAKLKVIGDISVDVEGAVEVTLKTTNPGNPVFVYDVDKKAAIDGVIGNGPVILAVDNLPAELPRESSAKFSNTLMPFIPELARTDFNIEFDDLNLIAPLKRAIICYHGKLTPSFEYLNEYLNI